MYSFVCFFDLLNYLFVLLYFGIGDMNLHKISTARCPFIFNISVSLIVILLSLSGNNIHLSFSLKYIYSRSELQILRNKIYKMERGESHYNEEGAKKCVINSYNVVENSGFQC